MSGNKKWEQMWYNVLFKNRRVIVVVCFVLSYCVAFIVSRQVSAFFSAFLTQKEDKLLDYLLHGELNTPIWGTSSPRDPPVTARDVPKIWGTLGDSAARCPPIGGQRFARPPFCVLVPRIPILLCTAHSHVISRIEN
jgi:hypothetical protein